MNPTSTNIIIYPFSSTTWILTNQSIAVEHMPFSGDKQSSSNVFSEHRYMGLAKNPWWATLYKTLQHLQYIKLNIIIGFTHIINPLVLFRNVITRAVLYCIWQRGNNSLKVLSRVMCLVILEQANPFNWIIYILNIYFLCEGFAPNTLTKSQKSKRRNDSFLIQSLERYRLFHSHCFIHSGPSRSKFSTLLILKIEYCYLLWGVSSNASLFTMH